MHYIIVILIILCIIGFQIYSYCDTKKKLRRYKGIFPQDIASYSISKLNIERDLDEDFDEDLDDFDDMPDDIMADDDGITVSQIHSKEQSSTLKGILEALNKYLQKNKGSASDFHLMKDIVERYCDAEEEEISTQQPIPLYLGLMGTMVGIIIGVAYVAISGGLAGDKIADNITELMSCVAIAMSASFIGVYFTTRISWKSKDVFSKVENDKNSFYSWLQTELLPTLSGDTVNALYLLQQNLATFNTTFQTNIAGLNHALEQVKNTSAEQVELIGLISDIDIKRVAQANITVLRELKDCTGELSAFNKYIHQVSDYLTAVNNLNSNINEHLNRTAAIERMGVFFEKEIEQVKNREQYINQVVANVDDTLRQTFESLKDSTMQGMTNLNNDSASQFDSVLQTMKEQEQMFKESLCAQREEFAKSLRSEHEAFLIYLQGKKESLSSQSDEITDLVKEIRKISETKSGIAELAASSKHQSSKLDALIRILSEKPHEITQPSEVHHAIFTIPAYLKISIVLMCAAAVASFGVGLYSANNNNPKGHEQAIIELNSKIDNLSKSLETIQDIVTTQKDSEAVQKTQSLEYE